jgi:hypothetical protein
VVKQTTNPVFFLSFDRNEQQIDTQIIHLNVYSLPPPKKIDGINKIISRRTIGECWVFLLIDVIHWRENKTKQNKKPI